MPTYRSYYAAMRQLGFVDFPGTDILLRSPDCDVSLAVWVNRQGRVLVPHFGYFVPEFEEKAWRLLQRVSPRIYARHDWPRVMYLQNIAQDITYMTADDILGGMIEMIEASLAAMPDSLDYDEYLDLAESDKFKWKLLAAAPLIANMCLVANEVPGWMIDTVPQDKLALAARNMDCAGSNDEIWGELMSAATQFYQSAGTM